MKTYRNETFDEERALYGADEVNVISCRFDGPADGESALKESRNIEVTDSYFNLRYPFWHDDNICINKAELTEGCRAALWYSKNVSVSDSTLHGIKALRECDGVKIKSCDIVSPEFGWFVNDIEMMDTNVVSEYFMLHSDRLTFDKVKLTGKYSFQYIKDSVFTNCEFDTKDAFGHAKNVTVKNSIIKGEYLAWYSENLTFENCTISGTQPLCYCKGLKLINCRMIGTDLAFEKSEVDASIQNEVDSIKNPESGIIRVPGVKEVIMDDANAKGRIITDKQKICACA